MFFHGPVLRMSSALNSELNASARSRSCHGRPDGRHGAGVGEPLGVAQCEVFDALVRVVDQPLRITVLTLPGPQAHLQGVQGEVAAQACRQLPAHDASAEHVDDERGVALCEGAAVGDVGDAQPVRGVGSEGAVDQVRPSVRAAAWHGRARALRPSDTAQPRLTHEALDRAAGDQVALAAQLGVDLADAVDAVVVRVGFPDDRALLARSLTDLADGGRVFAA